MVKVSCGNDRDVAFLSANAAIVPLLWRICALLPINIDAHFTRGPPTQHPHFKIIRVSNKSASKIAIRVVGSVSDYSKNSLTQLGEVLQENRTRLPGTYCPESCRRPEYPSLSPPQLNKSLHKSHVFTN
jgi:hypothetical protein